MIHLKASCFGSQPLYWSFFGYSSEENKSGKKKKKHKHTQNRGSWKKWTDTVSMLHRRLLNFSLEEKIYLKTLTQTTATRHVGSVCIRSYQIATIEPKSFLSTSDINRQMTPESGCLNKQNENNTDPVVFAYAKSSYVDQQLKTS